MRLVFLVSLAWSIVFCANVDDQQFNGRWNITANNETRSSIWWLEVIGASTGVAKGRFLGGPIVRVEEIPRISILDGELRFAIQERASRDPKTPSRNLLYFARMENGKLKGTFEVEGDPSSYLEWVGSRSPIITDQDDGTWKRGEPIPLFDGKDLAGWQPQTSKPQSSWSVKDGVLSNSAGAANLVSLQKFWNFGLHVEFRVSTRTNSGVGLRGRYEVKIQDDYDKPTSVTSTGSIFGRIAPTTNAADLPGVWQTFDIRLIGRQVTVVLNDIKVIDKQTIEGPTTIALDANEADPGPIVLRGDRGPIEFRKIVVYPFTKPH